MKNPKTSFALSLTAIACLFAIPAIAAAAEEAVVPPGNSAATQYTEAFPTSGGDKKTDQAPRHRSPTKVLGPHNAKKLESQGPDGKAVAETAAATAPASIAPPPSPSTSPSRGDGGGGHAGAAGSSHSEKSTGNGESAAPQRTSDTPNGIRSVNVSAPAGSSGLDAVAGQATGLSTTGGSGPLLPLVILATVVWSLAYLWRQRRRVD